ncbi:unnamed protein product [Cunninghamella echinulata]
MTVQWHRSKSDALRDGYLHVAKDVTSSGIKQFASVKTYEEISRIIDEELCVYEIVTSSWTEMYDFDGKDLACTEEDIISNFKQCRLMISDDTVHVKSSSTSSRISLHFVVPSVVLGNYEVMYVRYQRMMSISELKENVKRSMYGDEVLIRYRLSEAFRMDICLYGSVYRLKRILPSWCVICERVHERENASLDVDRGVYRCFRSPGECKTLDEDRLVLSRSKLVDQLKNYGLDDQEICDVISRSS